MTRILKFASAGAFATLMAAVALPAYGQVAESAGEAALTEGEVKLARLLEGRVAGEPENCIMSRRIRDFDIIDRTALVYEVGDVLYVNYTQLPEMIDDSDGLRTRQFGTTLCRQSIVTTFSRNNGLYTGNLFLTDFIPYRRVD